jgi:GxxExxY protein
MERDPFTGRIIGLAIEVHRVLGPGLLESTYQHCLAHELNTHGIPFLAEHPLPVSYKGTRLDCGYRIDLLVDGQLILELKAVEAVAAIHRAQLLTYLRLSGIRTGLLINFNVQRLTDGIERFVV